MLSFLKKGFVHATVEYKDFSNRCIWHIDGTLTGTTTHVQIKTMINGNQKLLYTNQISIINGNQKLLYTNQISITIASAFVFVAVKLMEKSGVNLFLRFFLVSDIWKKLSSLVCRIAWCQNSRYASVSMGLKFMKTRKNIVIRTNIISFIISYLPTPLLGQDMTQGQFLSGV